jgi:hypothetical protein
VTRGVLPARSVGLLLRAEEVKTRAQTLAMAMAIEVSWVQSPGSPVEEPAPDIVTATLGARGGPELQSGAVGMLVVDMPAAAQTHRVYDDSLAELARTEHQSFGPSVLNIVGPRNRVDKIIKKLKLPPVHPSNSQPVRTGNRQTDASAVR